MDKIKHIYFLQQIHFGMECNSATKTEYTNKLASFRNVIQYEWKQLGVGECAGTVPWVCCYCNITQFNTIINEIIRCVYI